MKHKFCQTSLTLIIINTVVLSTASAANAASLYTITDLGDNIYPYSINNAGQVVGTSEANSDNHAFLYSNGKLQDLGVLRIVDGYGESGAFGINNKGQVVGYSSTVGIDFHAFLYSNGELKDLGVPSGNYYSGDFSYAYGINDAGQVVGDLTAGAHFSRAFIYDKGKWRDLGVFGNGYLQG